MNENMLYVPVKYVKYVPVQNTGTGILLTFI